VLVNEQSGVTVTVTAVPNGSFKGFIRGAVDDLLSAVFLNGNGTRTTIPLQMQKFDDGRVALYSSGGVLTAPTRGTVMIRQGKGKKDRMIPIGERAIAWIDRYVSDVRPTHVVKSAEKALFLTAAGEAFCRSL